MKSLLSKSLVACMSAVLFLNTSVTVLGQTTNTSSLGMDDILNSYHIQTQDTMLNLFGSISEDESIEQIQENTVSALRSAGYDAYSVNSDTYYSMQSALSTDFEALGLDPNYSYIIVASGEVPVNNENAVMPASAGSSFTYTSDGMTYTMRYLTITAVDDPRYGKASRVDLLKSNIKSLIQNCLDTGISAIMSKYSEALGTVASICGLSISMFEQAGTTTLGMEAGTAWTRVHTQVWNDYDNMWQSGSCVESATLYSYITGSYYSATLNPYTNVPDHKVYTYRYSSKYSDNTWKKEQAVFGYTYNIVQYNTVGDAQYTYDNKVVITHVEDF